MGVRVLMLGRQRRFRLIGAVEELVVWDGAVSGSLRCRRSNDMPPRWRVDDDRLTAIHINLQARLLLAPLEITE